MHPPGTDMSLVSTETQPSTGEMMRTRRPRQTTNKRANSDSARGQFCSWHLQTWLDSIIVYPENHGMIRCLESSTQSLGQLVNTSFHLFLCTDKPTNKLRLPEQCCQPTSNIVMVDSCRLFFPKDSPKDSCLSVSIAYPWHYIKSKAFPLHLHQTSTSLGSQASLFHDSSDLPFRELMDLDTEKKRLGKSFMYPRTVYTARFIDGSMVVKTGY